MPKDAAIWEQLMLRMGMEEVNLDSGFFDLVWNGIAL